MMKKSIIIAVLLFFTNLCLSQSYVLPNEELLFSFNTKKGKKMVLVKDKNDKYIVYRFGTFNKIELEYPEKNKESWSKFTFSHYMRGGGIQNAGMELEALFFQIDNYEYSIYKDYFAEGEILKTGIIVTNLKTQKVIDIKGEYKSIEGNLYDLFQSGLILEDEDRIR